MFSSAAKQLAFNALRGSSVFAVAAATYHTISHPDPRNPIRNPFRTLTPVAFADSSLPNPAWSDLARRTGLDVPGLPAIPAAEIRKHNGTGADHRIWVTFGNAVYDVTEFVSGHPGGDQILLAAGGPLEPFWALYAQHKAEWVFEILEEYRIGNVLPDEQWQRDTAGRKNLSLDRTGPYANEPQRHPALIVQSQTPFNAEPDPKLMAATQLTPNDLFYVRNHMPVPVINPAEYRLDVLGVDGKVVSSLSLHDLKTKFKKYTVAATVQCAGNRRNELNKVKKVKGGKWDAGAISNAEWGGVRLRDVLKHVETSKAKHVCFEGLDADPMTKTVYAASVPYDIIDRVPDVLLAYEMNGEELPKDHGYPIRAIVPGVVGARNVKWLGKVVLSETESDSHWQKQDYRSFSPDVDWNNVDFSAAPSIQEMPVVSAICTHRVDQKERTVSAGGYAWSGDGKEIIRVDVSADGGKTWTGADLKDKGSEQERNQVFDWTLWSVTLPLPEEGDGKEVELVCKAIDSAYNTQPDSPEAIWNLRGLLNNSWHRIQISE